MPCNCGVLLCCIFNVTGPATSDGQDADEKLGVLPRGYQSAQIVRLGNLANGDTFTVNFEEDDWKQDNYIPVGRFSMLDVVGFNVQFNGQGSSHNMNVEIFTDYMPVRTNTPLITHKGKMTAIISDSKTAVNQNKYLNIIYRSVQHARVELCRHCDNRPPTPGAYAGTLM